MNISLAIILCLVLAVAVTESKRKKKPTVVKIISKVFSDDDEKKCLKKLRLTQNELSTAVQIRQIQARSGGTNITSMADMDRLINQLSPSLIAANRLKAKMPRLIECELTEFRPIMWGRPRA
ncbi:unnamed protein product [Ixodes persulcatus]